MDSINPDERNQQVTTLADPRLARPLPPLLVLML
jgi:hypothetical protein